MAAILLSVVQQAESIQLAQLLSSVIGNAAGVGLIITIVVMLRRNALAAGVQDERARVCDARISKMEEAMEKIVGVLTELGRNQVAHEERLAALNRRLDDVRLILARSDDHAKT